MKKIPLSKTGKKNKGKYEALIDDDVFPIVNEYNWCYSQGYACNSKTNILLHRFIWQLKVGEIPKGMKIDHQDRNGLNNCIDNLRLATAKDNAHNRSKNKNSSSNIVGVTHDKSGGYEYWAASIKDGPNTYTKNFPFSDLGYKLACEWRINKEMELYKDFSAQKDVIKDYEQHLTEEQKFDLWLISNSHKKNKKNKTGYVGITEEICGNNKKWHAQIKHKGKYYKKRFPYTEQGLQDAIEWYKQKSLELYKKDSTLDKDK